MQKKKVLIVMSATGGGHKSAAQSLQQAFSSSGHEVVVFDALPSVFKDVYSAISRHFLSFWGFLFWSSNRREKVSKLASRLGNRIAAEKMKDELFLSEPDFILSVHPLMSRLPINSFLSRGRKIPFGLVVVDPVTAHSVWFQGNPDVYFVPTSYVRDSALKAGVSSKRVFLSGFPIRDDFYKDVDIIALRKSLGLKPSLFTVMVGGSGEGVGKIFDLCIHLSELPIKEKFQVVVVSGRNRVIYEKLTSVLGGDTNFKILSYVDNMADWVHACDVVISKAGPNNLFEAVAAGKPFVAICAMPGQEEGNLDFIRKEKIGVVEGDILEVVDLISSWVEHPELLKKFVPYLARVRKEHMGASERIVRYIESHFFS